MALEIHCNSVTMDLPEIVLVNIKACPYYQELKRLTDYHGVLNEIKKEVQYMEPWVGNTKTPSTAFCLLYKCFLMKLTAKQLEGMMERQSNCFVRAIAMLYVRLVTKPEEMWEWLMNYVDDDQTIQVKRLGSPSTIGKFVRDVIMNMRYCDILLPRIPVPIHRRIKQELDEWDRQQAAKGIKGQRDDTDSLQEQSNADSQLSERAKERQREREAMKKMEQVRKRLRENRATEDGEEGETYIEEEQHNGEGLKEKNEEYRNGRSSKEKDRHRSGEREKDSERNRERGRDRDRDRDRDRYKDRERDKERYRDRNDRDRNDRDRKDRERERSDKDRDRKRERSDKDKDTGAERSREHKVQHHDESESESRNKRSRSRSQSRSPDRESAKKSSSSNGNGRPIVKEQSSQARLEAIRAMYGPKSAGNQMPKLKHDDSLGDETVVLGYH